MLKCRCGQRARLDVIDGTKAGKRIFYYACDSCGYKYTYDERNKVIVDYPPDGDDTLPF